MAAPRDRCFIFWRAADDLCARSGDRRTTHVRKPSTATERRGYTEFKTKAGIDLMNRLLYICGGDSGHLSMTSFNVHPTAIVDSHAEIGSGCEIGPYCVIGEHVVLGPGCQLHSHVVIQGHTVLGRENEVFPFASIGAAYLAVIGILAALRRRNEDGCGRRICTTTPKWRGRAWRRLSMPCRVRRAESRALTVRIAGGVRDARRSGRGRIT